MANPIFGTGLSGLLAAQLGMQTANHNVANVNTPGYSRQRVIQTTAVPHFTGAGFVGQGTRTATIERANDEFLEIDARATLAEVGRASAYAAQIGRIDRLFGDPAAGLAPALEEFFATVHDLAARPGDAAARQSMLSAAQALAARLRMIDDSLAQVRADVNRRIGAAVGEVNALASQIAALNERIAAARGLGADGHAPNDLLDQRDALLRDLARQVHTMVVPREDGAVSVFIGTGQPLVLDDEPMRLVALPGLESPQDLDVAIETQGTAVRLRPGDLGGGELGGLVEFRAASLDAAQNAIGRIAVALAANFNAQHALGQDATGALGGAFFAAGSPQVLPASGNAGGATLSATLADPAALTTSDYRLRFDGTGYVLTRLADGATQSFASLPQTVDGVTIAVAGSPAANDTFLIRPTRAGARDFAVLVSDPARIAAAAPVRTSAALANAGTATISAGSVNGPPPPDPNLTQPVTITFNDPPTTFDVTGAGTGNPTGVPYVPGAPITYNGWTVTIEGAPAPGDGFAIGPNTGGSGDNRNALALAALQTEALLASGTATLAQGYAALVAQVGTKAREVDVALRAQSTALDATLAAREAVSGVNLDEEAANLLRYQQAYQAAARAISVAATLFDSILEIGR